MSRIANKAITYSAEVSVKIDGNKVTVKGPKGQLERTLHPKVLIEQNDNVIQLKAKDAQQASIAMAGTTRALVQNMVLGVKDGFLKKLLLKGVGYRARLQGKQLNLSLGFSHPVARTVPDGITLELPNQTEIIVNGIDKQLVGQFAAEIRSIRPPEPYKGKGIRYADEIVRKKEAKKK